jgi:hypothetical protein
LLKDYKNGLINPKRKPQSKERGDYLIHQYRMNQNNLPPTKLLKPFKSCPLCGLDLYTNDVLIQRAVNDYEEDIFEDMLCCPECDYKEEIDNAKRMT